MFFTSLSMVAISDEQYCYVTTYTRQDGRHLVVYATKPSKQTDTLTVYFDS